MIITFGCRISRWWNHLERFTEESLKDLYENEYFEADLEYFV